MMDTQRNQNAYVFPYGAMFIDNHVGGILVLHLLILCILPH
jgi:hypothetical protein